MADFQHQRTEDASYAIADHVIRNHGSLTPWAKADVVRFFTGYVKNVAGEDAPMSREQAWHVRQRLCDAAERVCALVESPLEFADLEPIASQTGFGGGRACLTLYSGEEVEVAGDDLRPFCRHVYSSPCLLADTRGGRCAFVDCSDNRKVWVVNPEKFNKRFEASGKRIPPSQITYQQLRARGVSHMQALKWMKANGATALPPPAVPKSTDYVYNAAGGGSIELTEAQLVAIGEDGVVSRSVDELVRVDPMLTVALDFYSMGLFPAHRIYQLFPGALVFFPRKLKDKRTRVYAVDQQAYEAASAGDPGTYPGVAGPVERAFNLFRGLGYNDDFSRAYARAFPGITPQDFQAMRAALEADPTMPISDVVAAASASGAISSKLGSAPDVYCDLGLRHVGEEVQRPAAPPAPPHRTAAVEALKRVVAELRGACSEKSNLRVLNKLDELKGSASLVAIWPSLPGADPAKVNMAPGNTLPVTSDLVKKLRGLAWAADGVGPRRRYLYPCTAMLLLRDAGETRESLRDDDVALYMSPKEFNSVFSDALGVKMTDEQCVLSTYYAFWASPQFMRTVNAGAMVKFYSRSGAFDAVAMKSFFLKGAIGAMETVLDTPGADVLKSGFDAALGVEDLVSIVKAYKTGALKALSTYDPTDKMECPTKPRIWFPSGAVTKHVAPPPALATEPARDAEKAKDAPAPARKKPPIVDTGVEPASAKEPAKESLVVDTGVGRDALLALNDIARDLHDEKIKPGEANTRSARNLGGLVMKRYDPRAPETFDASKPVAAVRLKPVLDAPEAEGADFGPSFAAKGHWWRYLGMVMIVVREPSHSRGPLKDRELAFFVPVEAYNKHLASLFGYTADIKDVIVSAASALMLPLDKLGSAEDLATRFRTPTGYDTRGLLGHIANAARAHLVKEKARLEAVRDKASVKRELSNVRIMLRRFDRGEIAAVAYDAVAKKPHSQPRDSGAKGKGTFSRLRRTLGLTAPKVSGRGQGQAPQAATAAPAAAPSDTDKKKKSGLFSRLRGFARRFVRENIGAPVGARCLVSDDVDAVIALVAACGLEADAMVTELRDRRQRGK